MGQIWLSTEKDALSSKLKHQGYTFFTRSLKTAAQQQHQRQQKHKNEHHKICKATNKEK